MSTHQLGKSFRRIGGKGLIEAKLS